MKRFSTVLLIAATLISNSQFALAEGIEECDASCDKQYSECIAKANEFVNDVEIRDAKAVCVSASASCRSDCMIKEQNRGSEKPAETKSE